MKLNNVLSKFMGHLVQQSKELQDKKQGHPEMDEKIDKIAKGEAPICDLLCRLNDKDKDIFKKAEESYEQAMKLDPEDKDSEAGLKSLYDDIEKLGLK